MGEITRFRIEGKQPGTNLADAEKDKQALIEFLTSQATRYISLLNQIGEWECTEDVVARLKDSHANGYHGYAGRMVFQFQPSERS